MIKAEQIPDVCAQEAYRVWFKQGATWKDVVAAALAAWPGMVTNYSWDASHGRLILPLTENTNAEG